MSGTVLVLANNIGGLYNFRRELIEAVLAAGYDVVVSVPEDSPRGDFFRRLGCKVVLTEFRRRGMNPAADFKLMLAYRRLLKQLRPVAVLTFTIKPNVYGGMAARLCHVPQLANITGLGDAVENGGWLQKLAVILYKLGLRKAERVFFQNESNREFCIRAGLADAGSVLLPGSGVNLQYHSFQEYPPDEGIVRFLFIGRLLKDKGTEELFETARAIKEKYPQAEFRIVGSVEGNYQSRLDELEKAGIISFLGPQPDVRPFIGEVECTVMPSYHEGMSNVNLESAANGRPVITTDVPGCRETVDDACTGYLVEPGNAESLQAAVERFILLPYRQKILMGKNARRKVEKEFDRKIVVNAYLKELEQIANV